MVVEKESVHSFQRHRYKFKSFRVRQIPSMFLVLGFAFGSRSLDEVEEKYKKIHFLKEIYIAEIVVVTATACWSKFGLKFQ